MTSFLLARAGLPSPRTWSWNRARRPSPSSPREAGPLVLKPLFGSQGKGLRLVRGPDDLPPGEAVAGVYYLQRFAGREDGGLCSDYRVFVCDGRVAATMMRQAASWITNIKQGATALPMPPMPSSRRWRWRRRAAVGGDFCGVDLLRDATGAAHVLEVNSMPAWTGLQKASGVDMPMPRPATSSPSSPPGPSRGTPARWRGRSELAAPPAAIADLYREACRAELAALKPGNVHASPPATAWMSASSR